MIDAEVIRLRKLRHTALRTRALAQGYAAAEQQNPVFMNASRVAWSLARLATGHLKGHPYETYQQGPSGWSQASHRLAATVASVTESSHERRLAGFARQLSVLSRDLDDTRAVTWSPDLSDALGRHQKTLQPLLEQFHVGRALRSGRRVATTVKDVVKLTDWPYLAI